MKKMNFDGLSSYEMESIKKTEKAIKEGKIYVNIESVSKSGMSRRMRFWRIEKNALVRCTCEVAWLSGYVTAGKYQQGGKYLIEGGLRVGGCGMDVILHTLLRCLPEYGEGWNQRYNTI